MRLIIAEKPSLARAIADALPVKATRREGYLEAGDTVVSWCLGHLLEQAAPERYDPRYKQWRLDDLPIVPERWQLVPRSQARAQLAVLRKLVKGADSVVHAGDPDREGQLLVQEVLNHLNWNRPTQRLLVQDLNRPAVARALASLEDNQRYQPLYAAAEARSRADWLYGINLTRAWTLIGRQAGFDGLLSVGRVQTPVLGLVVRRDRDIAAFEPKPFYLLWADLKVARGALRAWWQPGERHLLDGTCFDEQGRLLDPRPAEALAQRLVGAQGHLVELDQKRKRQAAPLPYSLSSLQIDAARRHGLSAKRVLDVCQTLYERHQLITYPRSDCRYLPAAHHREAARTLTDACRLDGQLQEWVGRADFGLRSKAWDDTKVGAHHALAPTGRPADLNRLSRDEANLFRLIARNVLAQFYPALETYETRAVFELIGERFQAQGREVLEPGWKPLFTTRDDVPALPPLTRGETASVTDASCEARETRPPEPFTDASLIKAMMNIARYVEDPAVKRTLRESDGLGTEATRAGIIETLLTRGYLVRDGKAIRATRTGHALIDSLPPAATRPERTALWEQRLSAIAENQDAPAPFLTALIEDLHALLAQADAGRLNQALAASAQSTAPVTPPPKRGRRATSGRKAGARRSRGHNSSSSSRSTSGSSNTTPKGKPTRARRARKPDA
ncbi:DNA topoisomerase III [Salinicola acroporae]|uniref:DNA topoisomerase n=1 Tax=Salinicola acroporae TaxID=1541440 RepID=A0ABT6I6Q6_9GAMM|nr:DNA topoisomerase III [Salinicola acroporae]MDH4573074.1 DNA topoisomerase III [Salinicola acroporae]